MKTYQHSVAPFRKKTSAPPPSRETRALISLLEAREIMTDLADCPDLVLPATAIRLELEQLLEQLGHQIEHTPF